MANPLNALSSRFNSNPLVPCNLSSPTDQEQHTNSSNTPCDLSPTDQEQELNSPNIPQEFRSIPRELSCIDECDRPITPPGCAFPELSVIQELLQGKPHTEARYLEHFSNVKRLGEGSTGVVCLAERLQTGQLVVVKKLKPLSPDLMHSLTSNFAVEFYTGKAIETLTLRTAAQRQGSPITLGVPKMLELFVHTYRNHARIILVEEFIEGQDLYSYIQEQQTQLCADRMIRRIQEPMVKTICRQLMQVLEIAHKSGITHRDIKPGNIFVNKNANGDIADVKLLDWGAASIDRPGIGKPKNTFPGTVRYMAPDVCRSGGYENPPLDSWSLGVTLYELLTGTLPFTAYHKETPVCKHCCAIGDTSPTYECVQWTRHHDDIMQQAHVSTAAIDLIKKLLTINPEKRLPIAQVATHPWLQEDSPI